MRTSSPLPLAGMLTLIAFVFFAGCDNSDPDPDTLPPLPQPRVVADSSYTVTPSGLRYFDFQIGDTLRVKADSGDVVLVHYHGWLEDGTLFDSSIINGRPIQFVLGTSSVIPGFNEGIHGMYLGGERQLVIPPELGYGNQSRGTIPPNSTLIFELVLLGTQ